MARMSRRERKLAREREDRRREMIRRAYLSSQPVVVSPSWVPYGIAVAVELSAETLGDAAAEPPASHVRLVGEEEDHEDENNLDAADRLPVDVLRLRVSVAEEDDDDKIIAIQRIFIRDDGSVATFESVVRYDAWRERDALRLAREMDPKLVLDWQIFMVTRRYIWTLSTEEAAKAVLELAFCPTLKSFLELRSRYWTGEMKGGLQNALCGMIRKRLGPGEESEYIEALWGLFQIRVRRQDALGQIARWLRQRWQMKDVDAWIAARVAA